jgi:hypothetical protein
MMILKKLTAIISMLACHATATSYNWTWVAGPSGNSDIFNFGTIYEFGSATIPRNRQSAVAAIDSQLDLVMIFGGYRVESGQTFLNDLWFYDLLSNHWAWYGGSQSANVVADYSVSNQWPGSTEYPSFVHFEQEKLLYEHNEPSY